MGYDGTLKFDTKVDTTGFFNGLGILKKAGVAGGAAVSAGLGVAIKKGMDFEAQMSTVQSISGASAEEMVLLKKKAEEMGARTVFSASESGKAFEYMAAAGWTTGDMLGGIEGIMNLAASSGESLATSSDIVTDALTAFGLKASDSAMFADVLAAASAASNTNVGMMGETFKYVAPVAGALGYSVQDVSVAIGLMANSGIKAGQAGTSLRAILTRLAKPTKQSAAAMEKLGISLTDSKGEIKPFGTLMGDLRQKFSKLTQAEKVNMAALLGGQEAMSGLLAIVNASDDDFTKLKGAIDNASGSAKAMSETRLDNLAGDMEELSGAAETLGLRFYDGVKEPIREAVQSATGELDKLGASLSGGELSGALQNTGEALGGLVSGAASFATGAVPVVISAISWLSENLNSVGFGIGVVTSSIMGCKAAMSAGTAVTSLFNGVLGALSNPLGIIGMAAGGAAAGFLMLKNAEKQAEEEFYNMGDALDECAAKFQETKDKATLTSDYAQKWRDLNKAISDGSLSGEDLKNAEAERKSIEEWFIANYGQYISAEEQKNGIREEVIGAIEKQVQILSEQQRLELENQALEAQRKLPDLMQNISQMKSRNEELRKEKETLLNTNNTIMENTRCWTTLTREQKNSPEYKGELQKAVDNVNKALGTEYKTYAQIEGVLKKNKKALEENKTELEENQKYIDDGTASIQSYADACRGLIEQNLGDTLEGFANGYNLVKQAQEEVNTSGKISAETLQALIEKYPEMKEGLEDSDKAPQALADKMGELEGKLSDAWKKADEFETKLNGLPKELNIDIKLNVPEVPQFAHGTTGASEGPAIVNDGNGPELIQSRSGAFRMIRSTGAALTWLNSGDRVYTAEQTRSILRGVPRYAGGIGNGGYVGTVSITSFIDKVPEAFEKALEELQLKRDLDVTDEQEYYRELEMLRDKHFQKGSDEWWKYEKEIYSFRKENAEKLAEEELQSIQRQLDLELISEEEYYAKLSEFRDKYYSEGSKEYQEYSDEIYKYHKRLEEQAVNEDFDRLKKSLDRGYITEKEYYSALSMLRDKHFEEGSEEWQRYTDEIINYQRQSMKAMADRLMSEKNSTAKLFYNDSIILVGEGKGRELTPDGWLNHEGEDVTLGGLKLNDYEETNKTLREFIDTLVLLENRGVDSEIIDYLRGLETAEGLKQAKLYLEATDEELQAHIAGRKEYDELIKAATGGVSSALPEVKKSASEVGDAFTTELGKYFGEVPESFKDFGRDAAGSFGDGFISVIQSELNRIADELINDIERASERFKSAATGGGTVINNYNSETSYVVGNSGQTVTEQLNEIRRNEEFERLRG